MAAGMPSAGFSQSGRSGSRGLHTPSTTFAIATASSTQSEFSSALSDTPSFAGSTDVPSKRCHGACSSCGASVAASVADGIEAKPLCGSASATRSKDEGLDMTRDGEASAKAHGFPALVQIGRRRRQSLVGCLSFPKIPSADLRLILHLLAMFVVNLSLLKSPFGLRRRQAQIATDDVSSLAENIGQAVSRAACMDCGRHFIRATQLCAPRPTRNKIDVQVRSLATAHAARRS